MSDNPCMNGFCENIIADEICEISEEPEPEVYDEDFTEEEINKINGILNKRKANGEIEKYETIKNPFVSK